MTTSVVARTHPSRSGATGAVWYSIGQFAFIATRLVAIIAAAEVMRSLTAENFDAIVPLLLILLGILVVVQFVNRRIFRRAWAEVPGAFGWRSVERGDRLEPLAPARVDIAWLTVRTGAWIGGGIWLANLDGVSATMRVAAVAGFGAWELGAGVAFAVTSWSRGREQAHWIYRFQLFTLIEGIGWVVIGAIAASTAGLLVIWTGLIALLSFCIFAAIGSRART